MKFINQLNLPRKSEADIAKNIKTLSIKQVEYALQPEKPRTKTSNLCEYLQGENLVVKIYFDSDQYYKVKPGDAECDRILEAFKSNIASFMQNQHGFEMASVKFAAPPRDDCQKKYTAQDFVPSLHYQLGHSIF